MVLIGRQVAVAVVANRETDDATLVVACPCCCSGCYCCYQEVAVVANRETDDATIVIAGNAVLVVVLVIVLVIVELLFVVVA